MIAQATDSLIENKGTICLNKPAPSTFPQTPRFDFIYQYPDRVCAEMWCDRVCVCVHVHCAVCVINV